MIEKIPDIEAADYDPIERFSLSFRWTDSRWNEFPPQVLADIRPLRKEKARELCQYSLIFSNRNGLIEEYFAKIEETSAAQPEEMVKSWLLSRGPEENSKVVVSWDNELAVLVGWGVFCSYWNDFCYPTSDDVAIFPLSEDWMLLYDHAEVFSFGRRFG